MSYSVNLEAYQGPLDLLLDLISRDRVDPAEISISTITDEYLKAVARLEETDLNVASSFLILAATLMELKSLKLLPKKQPDPDLLELLEERDHLIHRLIEYSAFKGAAERFSELRAAHADMFFRCVAAPRELRVLADDLLDGVTPARLFSAAEAALRPKQALQVDLSHITPAVLTVGEMVARLADTIRGSGSATFRRLCSEAATRMEVVVGFLALLEMYKDQLVDLHQEQPFDEIVVSWRRAAQTV